MSYRVTAGKGPISLNEKKETAAILQNVATILSTPKGTVPLYRDFGISRDIIDRPIPIARNLLVAEVTEAVEEYEPRVRVVSVTSEIDPEDPGRLIPTVEVEIVDE